MAQTRVLILRLPSATEERLSLIPNQSRRKASNAMKLASQCLVQEGKCQRLEKEISRWKAENDNLAKDYQKLDERYKNVCLKLYAAELSAFRAEFERRLPELEKEFEQLSAQYKMLRKNSTKKDRGDQQSEYSQTEYSMKVRIHELKMILEDKCPRYNEIKAFVEGKELTEEMVYGYFGSKFAWES